MRSGMHALAALAVLILAAPSLAAAQSPELPRPTDAQLHGRAAVNANALTAVAIADARARGVSPREWGLAVGREFAQSWGASQTPQSLMRGMWVNMLSLNPGIELRAGEYGDDVASILLPADFPAFLADPDGWFGVTREEFRAAVGGLAEGVAGRFDIRATLEARPDAVALVFRR